MSKRALILLSVIMSASILVSSCKTTAPSGDTIIAEGVNIGNRAIDFTLPTLDGKPTTLSDYRGKPVLLNFWATWCGPCRFEIPFLHEINDTYSSRGLVMLAVDVGENSTTVTNFMTSLNASLPILLDTDIAVSKAYGLTGIPTTFLLDKDGIIRFKLIGAFPNKAAIEDALKTVMP